MARVGSGFIGSSQLETSVSNEELVDIPKGFIYSIDFVNLDDATLIINSEVEIFLYAGQGFKVEYKDATINSLKIKENGVRYTWNGKFQ